MPVKHVVTRAQLAGDRARPCSISTSGCAWCVLWRDRAGSYSTATSTVASTRCSYAQMWIHRLPELTQEPWPQPVGLMHTPRVRKDVSRQIRTSARSIEVAWGGPKRHALRPFHRKRHQQRLRLQLPCSGQWRECPRNQAERLGTSPRGMLEGSVPPRQPLLVTATHVARLSTHFWTPTPSAGTVPKPWWTEIRSSCRLLRRHDAVPTAHTRPPLAITLSSQLFGRHHSSTPALRQLGQPLAVVQRPWVIAVAL